MSRTLRNENGIALITAILFLLVLSVLVAALHYTTILEHVSSRKYQNSQQAFYAAEKGIRRGMGWLASQGGPPEEGLTADPWFSAVPLAGAPAIWADTEVADGCTNTYHIEHLKKEATSVTAHGSGKKGTTTSSGALLHYYRITGMGSSRSVPAGTVQLQLVTTVTY